jgi:glyoxylase-like metal-dependent hydrolase (beta-lactamase superfamily II)
MPTPFPVGTVNAWLVQGDVLTLVDAGVDSPQAFEALQTGVSEAGARIQDIERILLTHVHYDHVGLLGRIVDESGAEAWAHPSAVGPPPRRESASDFLSTVMRQHGVPDALREECVRLHSDARTFEEIPVDARPAVEGDPVGGFRPLFVPGHSAADTVWLFERSRAAFVGDHLLKEVQPNPVIRRPGPDGGRPKSLVEFRESLLKTRELEMERCFPGHGSSFSDHRRLIDGMLRRQDKKADQVEALLPKAARTAFEVALELFPKLDAAHLFLGLSVAVGYLELLDVQRRAICEYCEELIYWRRNSC